MKVALLQKPGSLVVTQKNLRALAADEVLVKVELCGVCGTDLHILDGTSRSNPPVVLGHEFAGVVEEVGSGVERFKVGAAVAVDPNISCGTCYFCRRGEVHLCESLRALGVDIDGGMAERCIVPASQLYSLPANMPFEQAAFIEPLSCALHGIDRARIRQGDTVAILGAGTVGLLMVQLARLAGASRVFVVEPLRWKREIALKIGADRAIDPGEVNPVTPIRTETHVGADVVIECVGHPSTVATAFELVRKGGTVELFGVCSAGVTVPVEPHAIFSKELTIVGSYVNPHTFDRAKDLLASKKVSLEHFIMRRFPLASVHEALNSLKEGTTVKSFVEPSA